MGAPCTKNLVSLLPDNCTHDSCPFECSLQTGACAALPKPQPPPNILILLADDLGLGDFELYCGTRWTDKKKCPATPNVNGLAMSDSTVYFHRFYAAAATCSPTRASVLTGRNNRRSCIDGVIPNCWRDDIACKFHDAGISRTEYSIADAVKQGNPNYMTQFVGKW